MNSVTPTFFYISYTSNSLSVLSKNLRKIYRLENFRANVLKTETTDVLSLRFYGGVKVETFQGLVRCNSGLKISKRAYVIKLFRFQLPFGTATI